MANYNQQNISERTKSMKENFIKHRNDGKSISEIAKIYGLNSRTIYLNLQDIADENNVSRDSLLYHVHKPHTINQDKVKNKKEKVNPKALQEEFTKMLKHAEIIIATIDETLQNNYDEEEIDED